MFGGSDAGLAPDAAAAAPELLLPRAALMTLTRLARTTADASDMLCTAEVATTSMVLPSTPGSVDSQLRMLVSMVRRPGCVQEPTAYSCRLRFWL
jgi:hypothetical protein